MARICLFAVCSKRDFLMGVALKGGGEMKHHPAMGNLKRYYSPWIHQQLRVMARVKNQAINPGGIFQARSLWAKGMRNLKKENTEEWEKRVRLWAALGWVPQECSRHHISGCRQSCRACYLVPHMKILLWIRRFCPVTAFWRWAWHPVESSGLFLCTNKQKRCEFLWHGDRYTRESTHQDLRFPHNTALPAHLRRAGEDPRGKRTRCKLSKCLQLSLLRTMNKERRCEISH